MKIQLALITSFLILSGCVNNPADRNRYGIDLDAQRRDMQKINPGSLDDLRGQNGGGYNGR